MPDEVTTGEVYRLLLAVQKDVREMRADVVGRKEYEADQEGIDRRFQDSASMHTRLEGQIAAVVARVDATEKEQRQNRSKWTFAIVMAVVTPILGVVVSVLFRGGV